MLFGARDRNFVTHYTNASRKGVVITGLIGLLLYDAYAVVDYLTQPDLYPKMWLIRLGITLFSIGTLGLISTPVGARHLRGLTLTVALAISLSVIWIWSVVYPKQLPKEITGITVTMLFCMAGLRLLMFETITYAIIMSTAFFALTSMRNVEQAVLASYFVSIPLVVAIGVSVSYLTEMYARKSYLDELMLMQEREKSDHILKMTFPLEIANQLKNNPGVLAKREDNVTIMFCDIIGFTEACTRMLPEDLVNGLNQIFSTLDRLTREHQCEKIKTIGDAYLAVSGVPNATPDHAERIIKLALAVRETVPTLTLNGTPIRVRIGVHTGPVVAGVIGESRFAYDLWGDTVNTASRMESTAPEGSIQITETTKEAIQDKFLLEKRPKVQIKGKGLMDTWLILGPKQSDSSSESTLKEQAA
jgi:class 3 adenylate cyclase